MNQGFTRPSFPFASTPSGYSGFSGYGSSSSGGVGDKLVTLTMTSDLTNSTTSVITAPEISMFMSNGQKWGFMLNLYASSTSSAGLKATIQGGGGWNWQSGFPQDHTYFIGASGSVATVYTGTVTNGTYLITGNISATSDASMVLAFACVSSGAGKAATLQAGTWMTLWRLT